LGPFGFGGCVFALGDDVQEAVAWWFKQERKEFFADGIHQLVYQCYSCLNACYDFFLTAAISSLVSILERVAVACASYKWSVRRVLVCVAYVSNFL
jgi:hypothetical protein